MKFRICRNKYNEYKIQKRRKEIKLFRLTLRKKWKDYGYFYGGNYLYRSEQSAQRVIDMLIREDETEKEKNWRCV